MPQRIGLVGAALALATQLAIVLAPMPRMADDGALLLARVAALWGLDTLCRPLGSAKGKADGQPGPLAGHDCPICQVLQQSTAFLPPAAAAVALVPVLARHPASMPAADRPTRPVPSPAQPRAPPSIA